jgi:hypothetical protein
MKKSFSFEKHNLVLSSGVLNACYPLVSGLMVASLNLDIYQLSRQL